MSGAYLPLSTRAENYGPFPSLNYTYEPGVTAVIGENGARIVVDEHAPVTDAVDLYLASLDVDEQVRAGMRDLHGRYAEEVGA